MVLSSLLMILDCISIAFGSMTAKPFYCPSLQLNGNALFACVVFLKHCIFAAPFLSHRVPTEHLVVMLTLYLICN